MVGPVLRLMAQVPVISPDLRRLGIHDHDAKGPDSSPLILPLHATAGRHASLPRLPAAPGVERPALRANSEKLPDSRSWPLRRAQRRAICFA